MKNDAEHFALMFEQVCKVVEALEQDDPDYIGRRSPVTADDVLLKIDRMMLLATNSEDKSAASSLRKRIIRLKRAMLLERPKGS